MIIDVIGSGSDGNCYVIKPSNNSKEWLMIECGIHSKVMLKSINYMTLNIVGCIVSHVHTDHSGYIKSYKIYGFPIYSSGSVSNDIYEKYGIKTTALERNKVTKIGRFKVVPFRVPHTETECDGFLINHPEIGNLLFITDAEMCPFDMSKIRIDHALVECNYVLEEVDIDSPNKDHIMNGHMELATCKRFIKTLETTHLKSVGLIHLSHINSDSELFKSEIQSIIPDKKVWIAEDLMSIEL